MRASSPPAAPAPAAVDPPGAYAGPPASVVLRGDDFIPAAVQQLGGGSAISVDTSFRAFMGTAELGDVRWVDLHTIAATVPGGLAPGVYGVSVQGPFGTGNRDALFRITDALPAALSAQVSAPQRALVGQEFVVTEVVTNTGQMAALGVQEAQPTAAGPVATIQPSGQVVDLAGGSAQTFTWTVRADAPGTLQLTLPVAGTDEVDLAALQATSTVAVEIVTAADLAAFAEPAPAWIQVDVPFDLVVDVRNDGGSDATAVSFAPPSGSNLLQILASPAPQDVPAGATVSFRWTVKGTSSGFATVSAGGSGTDATDGAALVIPPVSWGPITLQAAAALEATLAVAPGVPLGDTFAVTLTITNLGVVGAHAVQPSIATTGAGTVTLLTAPGSATLPAGQTVAFTWTFQATGAGGVQFAATAAGADDSTGQAVSASASGATVLAQAAPVATDPFGDGSGFSYVFAYDQKVYLGPRQNGMGGVRMNPDGTGVEQVSFVFQADPGNNDSTYPGPWHTLGFNGCTPNQDSCGPDNEDGRGLFTSAVIGSTETLVAVGSRSTSAPINSKLKHVYTTADTTTAPVFPPTAIALQGGVKGVSSVAALGSTLFVGFAATTPKATILSFAGGTQTLESPTLGAAGPPVTTLIGSMASFGGQLYAANGTGCSRRSSTGTWSDCTPPGWSAATSTSTTKTSDFLPGDKAAPAMATFAGRLFLARNTTAGPQLWSTDGSTWQQVASPGSGTISLLAATAEHLYVGYDGASGVTLFRSVVSTPPVNASDFAPFGGTGLGAGVTTIYDARAVAFGGPDYLYVAAGSTGSPVQVFRLLQ